MSLENDNEVAFGITHSWRTNYFAMYRCPLLVQHEMALHLQFASYATTPLWTSCT